MLRPILRSLAHCAQQPLAVPDTLDQSFLETFFIFASRDIFYLYMRSPLSKFSFSLQKQQQKKCCREVSMEGALWPRHRGERIALGFLEKLGAPMAQQPWRNVSGVNENQPFEFCPEGSGFRKGL
jgi:hypothetical protein